jgi:hypothetical protein
MDVVGVHWLITGAAEHKVIHHLQEKKFSELGFAQGFQFPL